MIHPVILSGGSGTRLWPMSRSLYPKQLLALVGERSLLQQTVLRLTAAKAPGEPDALMLVMPSDHVIGDLAAFRAAIGQAAAAARAGRLVSLGIRPERPETGYGYIAAGAPIDGVEGAFAVSRFVEKPDAATAERYVASGEYFWNSSIFMFPAALYLAEIERLRPDMLAACKK